MNYYEMLGLSQEMKVGELDEALRKLQRKWQSRTNAPSLERRQEAENMLQVVLEAKDHLTSEDKKEKYDKKLKKMKPENKVEPLVMDNQSAYDLIERAKEKIGQHKIAEALLMLKKAIHTDPDQADAYANYGYCLYQMQRVSEAVQAYETALALDSSNMSTYYDLIFIYVEQERFNIAEQYLDQALALAEDKRAFTRLKTFIYNRRGEYDKTITLVEEKLADGENVNRETLADLCDAYEAEALTYYQKGHDGYYYLTDENNVENAVACWEKTLPYKEVYNDPTYPEQKIKEIQDLKKKKFVPGVKAMYIIPVLGVLVTMQESSLNWLTGIIILYGALLTALAFVPVYKMNKAAIEGRKLPIQHFAAVNWGLVKGIGIVFTLMLAISNLFNNNRR